MSGPESFPSVESSMPENEAFLTRNFGEDTGWPPMEDPLSQQRSEAVTLPVIEDRDHDISFADGFMDAESGFIGRK